MSLKRYLVAATTAVVVVVSSVAGITPAHADDQLDQAVVDLQTAQNEAREAEASIAESQRKLEVINASLAITEQEIAEQEEKLAGMRQQAGRVAVASHQRSTAISVIDSFFQTDSSEDFLSEITVMHSVTSMTSEQFARLSAEEERLTELQTSHKEAIEQINEEISLQEQLKAEYDGHAEVARGVVDSLSEAQATALAERLNKAIIDGGVAELDAYASSGRASRSRVSGDPGPGVWPAAGPISSPFGYRTNPIGGNSELHDGTDVAGPCGTPVRAAWSGVVSAAGPDGGWGNRVLLNSGRYDSRYAHLSSISVSAGEYVEAGQIIGAIGTTGYSTGCHLHFSVWNDRQIIDPVSVINPG